MRFDLIELNVSFLRLSLKDKKEALEWAREQVDTSNELFSLYERTIKKPLSEEEREQREADKKEIETYLNVMKAIIEWEEARERVEALNGTKKDKKGREYSA